MPPPRRPAMIAMFCLLAVAVGAWWWSRAGTQGPPVWQGYVDADYVKVGPTQAGLLTRLDVARGEQVAKGAPLFAQDDTQQKAALDQAVHQWNQARDQLANLQSGGKPTEIAQAKANLADAQATLQRTQTDLHRAETLVHSGFTSRQSVDQARADALSAQAKVNALQAALVQIQAPLGRPEEIAAQRASVQAAQAAVAMAEWQLAQRKMDSPVTGRVVDVLARPGETLTAGAPVVSLLPPANILVRFFVPELDLASLHRGDPVTLACDQCQGGLTARISFISPQAEYTPPVIYSEASRSKLVYLVEAHPAADRAVLLNPGEPVQVRPGRAP